MDHVYLLSLHRPAAIQYRHETCNAQKIQCPLLTLAHALLTLAHGLLTVFREFRCSLKGFSVPSKALRRTFRASLCRAHACSRLLTVFSLFCFNELRKSLQKSWEINVVSTPALRSISWYAHYSLYLWHEIYGISSLGRGTSTFLWIPRPWNLDISMIPRRCTF